MVMAHRPRTFCSPFGATAGPGGGGGGGGTPGGPVINGGFPANVTVTEPTGFTFSVAGKVTGVSPFRYQWGQWITNPRPNSAEVPGFNIIAGAVDSSFSSPSSSTLSNGKVFCVKVTDANGRWSMSRKALLTVNSGSSGAAPTIDSQPSNVSVLAGATATLFISAKGTPTPQYKWQELRGTWTDIVDYTSPWTNFYGSSTNTLTAGTVASPLQVSDNARQFRCVVSNSNGSVNSSTVTLTVTAAGANESLCTLDPGTLHYTVGGIDTSVIATGLTVKYPTVAIQTARDPDAPVGYAGHGIPGPSFAGGAWDGNDATYSETSFTIQYSGGDVSFPTDGDAMIVCGFEGWASYSYGAAPTLKIKWGQVYVQNGKLQNGTTDYSSIKIEVLNVASVISSLVITNSASNPDAINNQLSNTTTSLAGIATLSSNIKVKITVTAKANKMLMSNLYSFIQVIDTYFEGS